MVGQLGEPASCRCVLGTGGGGAWSREASGRWKLLGASEAASRKVEGSVQMLSSAAGNLGPGEARELNREALVPSSLPSLGWPHTLRSGLRQPGLPLEKDGGPSGPQGVLHFRAPRSQPQAVSESSDLTRLPLASRAPAGLLRTHRAAGEVGVVRIVGDDRLRGAATVGVTATAAEETLPVLRREPLYGCWAWLPPRPPAAGCPVRSEEPTSRVAGGRRHGLHPPGSSNANSTARLPRDADAPARRVLAPGRPRNHDGSREKWRGRVTLAVWLFRCVVVMAWGGCRFEFTPCALRPTSKFAGAIWFR